MPNMAAFAPMPSPSVAMTARANPGLLRRPRIAYLRSCAKVSRIIRLLTPNRGPRVVPFSCYQMKLSIVTLAAALLVLPPQASAAQSAPLARVDSVVRAEMGRQKIPGVAVAVVKNGAVVVANGYGEANVEHHVPVSPETIFQTGS